MKILYISNVIPSENGAGANIDFVVLNRLRNNNDIDAVLLRSDKEYNSVPDFFNYVYCITTTNTNRIINSLLFPFLPCIMMFRFRIPVIKKIVELSRNNYDIIYFSFSQTAIYVFLFKLMMKSPKKILFIHDVLQQAFYRRYKNEKNVFKKFFFFFEFRKLCFFEKYFYKQFDLCVVLSQKDKEILLKMGIYAKVIFPIYKRYQFVYDKKNDNIFYIGYYGSFNRFENIDAVNYYLQTIHKEMIGTIPNYKYLILGKDADKYFSDDKYVEVHAFQADPSILLNKCKAAVIMLRYGAGIKIKVLELLYLGIPCFCTSVASEGILSSVGLVTNDNVEELSKKIILYYKKKDFNKEKIKKEFVKLYDLNSNMTEIDEIFAL
jgi:hypothetical protein